ncbi:MAG: hypothetical protein NTW12_15525 [Deltaproteobacteria bacterium]|nr:hypothetical protein [Deltaproteobacteria bacterium]
MKEKGFERGSDVVQNWFDQCEINLAHEADQVGLFEHSVLVGSAREFIIKRVLKTILPPVVHFGSGKVFDAKGKKSRQIDIIIYDSRFPVFEIEPGIGIYPLEGVIATIEVKSTITGKSLHEALENSMSLIQLTPGLEDQSPLETRTKNLIKNGAPPKVALQKVCFEFIPATYIYGFNTKLRKKALANFIDKWFELRKNPAVGNDLLCAVLPRVIVAGCSVGLLHDGYFKIDQGEDVISQWKKKNESDPRHKMSFWDTNRRFGWLMIHLIHTVCSRVGLTHELSGAKYGIDHYLNIADYFENDMGGKSAWHNMW